MLRSRLFCQDDRPPLPCTSKTLTRRARDKIVLPAIASIVDAPRTKKVKVQSIYIACLVRVGRKDLTLSYDIIIVIKHVTNDLQTGCFGLLEPSCKRTGGHTGQGQRRGQSCTMERPNCSVTTATTTFTETAQSRTKVVSSVTKIECTFRTCVGTVRLNLRSWK